MAVIGTYSGMAWMFERALTGVDLHIALLLNGTYDPTFTMADLVAAELLTTEGYNRVPATIGTPVQSASISGVLAPDVDVSWSKPGTPNVIQQYDALALIAQGSDKANSQVSTISGSPSTFLTTAAHELAVNDVVYFNADVNPTGLTQGTPYFVLSAGLTTTQFRVSTVAGGAAVTAGTSWTGTLMVGNGNGEVLIVQQNPEISGSSVREASPGQSIPLRLRLGQRAVTA